jgi:hypothetical protein
VSATDPEAQDDQTVRSSTRAFDGEHDRTRERDGTIQLRVRGLADQPIAGSRSV